MTTIEERLADLKALQENNESTVCPRCGRETMKKPLSHNALSRLADIYICDACGMDEAKLAWMNAPGSLYDWKGLQAQRPQSDFKARLMSDVVQQIAQHTVDDLKAFFLRVQSGEDASQIRFEAFESIPGLTERWTEPFRAHFEAKDGTIVVQFRNGKNGLQYAIGSLPKR